MWSLPLVTTTAEDRNCLRAIVGGHVTVTVQNFIVTYQRHQNVYPHTTHTKYRPLSEHSYAKP